MFMICIYIHMCIYIHISWWRSPDGTERATSANVQLLRLRKDLRAGSIPRDVVNFPSELRRRGSCTSFPKVCHF